MGVAKNGVTAVIKAAAKGWSEVVEKLIDRGANLEATTEVRCVWVLRVCVRGGG